MQNSDQKLIQTLQGTITNEDGNYIYLYGLQQLPMWVIIVLLGPVLSPFFWKYFVFALTNKRIILVRLSMFWKIKEVKTFGFNQITFIKLKKTLFGRHLILTLDTGEKYRIQFSEKALGLPRQQEFLNILSGFADNINQSLQGAPK